MISIPFFPGAWKDAVFFSPIQILSLYPKLKKESFLDSILERFQNNYYDLGYRFEYLMREMPKPETDKEAEVLGKLFTSSIKLKQIRIYDYNYRTMYSSDPKGPGFHKGLRLLGMQVSRASWVEDTDGFLLYRNSSGDLYLQILKEDGDRIVQEASGSKKSFLPRDFSEGILYWVYKKKEDDSELLETNLNPDSTLLPNAEVSNSEESKAMIHALLDKNSKSQKILVRPVWEKIVADDLEIFLSQPRKTRAEELLLILSAFGISLIALIFGILASRILFTIRMEHRFSEREEVVQVKTELVRLLGQFREKTK
ncbi:hypothetical protein EHQ81_04820 [Leptospira selangorensis]|uniref:Uncharacterized protein n=1 Tax=Leptospira selangorensis TaxID=2484982 RepID=A0A5F2C0V0_9LEPT|nr:hypothetical protein EHQ81_04820 [Leptospira selangorensis]TGM18722.1 hypothetical protein EHQ82_14885 [Leptospira selangorensis]